MNIIIRTTSTIKKNDNNRGTFVELGEKNLNLNVNILRKICTYMLNIKRSWNCRVLSQKYCFPIEKLKNWIRVNYKLLIRNLFLL